jgi:hypothetical protein
VGFLERCPQIPLRMEKNSALKRAPPIVGDWNGSGTTKVGVYRSSNGLFILDYDGDGQLTAADKVCNFGVGAEPGDLPVVGDWNGTGTSKVGVFRSGFLWILDTNNNHVIDGGDQIFPFGGIAGDVPIVGDWNAPVPHYRFPRD